MYLKVLTSNLVLHDAVKQIALYNFQNFSLEYFRFESFETKTIESVPDTQPNEMSRIWFSVLDNTIFVANSWISVIKLRFMAVKNARYRTSEFVY